VSILLDTCAVIWLANGDAMSAGSLAAIRTASRTGEVFVSPVSAWEIGLLATNPVRPVRFDPDPITWFANLLALPGIDLAPLTPEAAIASSFLPGRLYADPADRLLVATARRMNATLVTRDEKLVRYGQQGHARVVAC
jgi:PIN domain nuclease of toxin-antitoxin system